MFWFPSQALTMSPEERQEHHQFATGHVRKHTAQFWFVPGSLWKRACSQAMMFERAETFLADLFASTASTVLAVPAPLPVHDVVHDFKRAKCAICQTMRARRGCLKSDVTRVQEPTDHFGLGRHADAQACQGHEEPASVRAVQPIHPGACFRPWPALPGRRSGRARA